MNQKLRNQGGHANPCGKIFNPRGVHCFPILFLPLSTFYQQPLELLTPRSSTPGSSINELRSLCQLTELDQDLATAVCTELWTVANWGLGGRKKKSVGDNKALKVRPSRHSRVRLHSSRAFWWEVECTLTLWKRIWPVEEVVGRKCEKCDDARRSCAQTGKPRGILCQTSQEIIPATPSTYTNWASSRTGWWVSALPLLQKWWLSTKPTFAIDKCIH